MFLQSKLKCKSSVFFAARLLSDEFKTTSESFVTEPTIIVRKFFETDFLVQLLPCHSVFFFFVLFAFWYKPSYHHASLHARHLIRLSGHKLIGDSAQAEAPDFRHPNQKGELPKTTLFFSKQTLTAATLLTNLHWKVKMPKRPKIDR